MKEANRRKHERLRKALLGEAAPDMTGWTETERAEWSARNGRFTSTEAAIEADRQWRADEEAREQREAAEKASSRRDDAPIDEAKLAAPSMAAAPPRPLPEPDPPPPPPLPIFTPDADEQRRLDYLKEKARWRLRTRDEDCNWETQPGTVIHEYDPLAED